MKIMHRLITPAITAVILGTSVTVIASAQDVPVFEFTTEIPDGITTPDNIETRLGELNFFDGVPDAESTEKIYNLIRGANPSPGAVAKLGEQRCAFYDATPSDQKGKSGTVIGIAPDSFTVATGDGAITVSSAKPPGQKKLAAADVITSLNLKVGDRFTS